MSSPTKPKRTRQPDNHVVTENTQSPRGTPRRDVIDWHQSELREIAAAAKGEINSLGLREPPSTVSDAWERPPVFPSEQDVPAASMRTEVKDISLGKIGSFTEANTNHGSFSKQGSSVTVGTDENRSGSSLPAEPSDPLRLCHHVGMLFSTAAPNAVLIVCFSAMGFGFDVYNAVADQDLNVMGNALIGLASFIFLMLYILNWSAWRTMWKFSGAMVPLVVLFGGAFLKAQTYPWILLLVTIFMVPLQLGYIRAYRCGQVRRTSFYLAVSFYLGICAVVTLAAWLVWIFLGDYLWSEETRLLLVDRAEEIFTESLFYISEVKKKAGEKGYDYQQLYDVHCGKDKDVTDYSNSEREDIGAACANAATICFLVYSCPFIGFCCNAVLCIFCVLQGMVSLESLSRLQRVLKQFVLFLGLLLGGAYASMNFSGASFRLGSTLIAFFMAAVVALIAWAYVEIGTATVMAVVKGSELMKLLARVWVSDWSRAVFVGAVNVFIPLYFVANRLNMKVQKLNGRKHDDIYTPGARKLLKELDTWNWVRILARINFLGELFFVFQVGIAKATYVFLSWLNDELETMDFSITIIICLIVGYTMFLLPPVPGIPVYVFVGIVLGEQGRRLEKVGFGGGIAIALGISFFLKQIACIGQYMIGYYMGKSLKIQQLIGVDKVPTRAIEYILSARGLTVGKVCVLVGGPDWPTSVTCGILKLNIGQMCLGTCPVIFVVGPCVFAGAFLGRVTAGEDSIWNMLANISIGVSVVLNMGSMFIAVYKVMRVVQIYGEDLSKPRKEHEAVAELTRREAAYMNAYRDVTSWKMLHPARKGVLITAAGMQLLAQATFTLAGELCFRSFNISSKIHDPKHKDGLDGNALDIIIFPVGWSALTMSFVAAALHIYFERDMTRLTQRHLQKLQKNAG